MALALSLSRLASTELRTLMRRRLAGFAAMLVAAAAIVLGAVLLTYDPHDPSLNTATASPARNLLGPTGATVADLLLQGFGAAAALLFAQHGAAITVCDIDAAKAQATAASVSAAGGRAIVVAGDVM